MFLWFVLSAFYETVEICRAKFNSLYVLSRLA